MKKPSIKHLGFLIFLIYLCLLTVPYLPHKKVSQAYKQSFQSRQFYSNSAGTERVAYIDDNVDALLYRLNLINEAENNIILSTFDFNADESGKDMMAALLSAADRGVQIQILVDGLSGTNDIAPSPWFQALASHEQISIKIYNPVNLLTPWKLQARLHDKYLIIDEQMYLLGGRNTYDLFLGDYSSKKNIDRELFVWEETPSEDASIHQLKHYFESVWSHPDSKTFHGIRSRKKVQQCETFLKERDPLLREQYEEAYRPWDYQSMTMPASKVSLLCNPINPGNKEPWMWYSIHQLMEQGKRSTIYTPYIICGREMYQDLTSLCEKAEEVEIITNDVSNGANPWGCTDYLNQRKKIWGTGVTVYEYMGTHSLHTKAVLIDDRMSLIGSYNLDMRSTYQDTELMLAVDCVPLNKKIRQEAERDKISSRSMTSQGTYFYGESYVPKALSVPKQIFYTVLRVLIVPFRRFL